MISVSIGFTVPFCRIVKRTMIRMVRLILSRTMATVKPSSLPIAQNAYA
jgi:hypothetical protein